MVDLCDGVLVKPNPLLCTTADPAGNPRPRSVSSVTMPSSPMQAASSSA